MNPHAQGAMPMPQQGEIDPSTLPQGEAMIPISAPEEDDEARRMQLERRQRSLDEVGQSLSGWFREAVTWRSDFEKQWLEDLDQFETGGASIAEAKTPSPTTSAEQPDYAKTGDNITRPAVLLMTARVADMLFPTSDRNWDMEPSPKPNIDISSIPQQKEDGTPLTPQEIKEETDKLAKRKCEAMRTRIDDQLQEANYAGVGRDAIFDGHLFGTGVIKGPFPRVKICRKPDENGKWVRQFEESPTPSVKYVDLFQFYPRPARNIRECEGVFELELMNETQVRKLAREPGFSKTQIARILKTPASASILAASPLFQRASATGPSVLAAIENKYAFSVYTGALPRDAVVSFTKTLLEEAKIDPETAAEILVQLQDDELVSVMCEAWECNGIVAKLVLRPVDDDGPIYHIYNYEKRADAIFGKGVPYVMRDDQLAARQLWQAMMLNAFMSSGLQIAVNKGRMEPMGPNSKTYDMTFTRPRVWEFDGETKDIREAFQVFEIPNIIDKVMPMYERAKTNGQEHAMIPSIAQGEPTTAVPTSSGLSMLMNAANIVSRQLVKNYDDDVTNPLITGLYDWNLSSDEVPEDEKGDYSVIPRGVSHLLVKDVQAQRFLYALTIYSANPELAGRAEWGEWARMGLVVMELDAGRLLMDEDAYQAKLAKQNENPPQDPRVLAEQNRARQIELEAEHNARIADIQREEIAARERMTMQTAASDERVAQLNYMSKLATLDEAAQKNMREIEKDLSVEGLWARLEAEKIAAKERNDALEVRVEDTPRLA